MRAGVIGLAACAVLALAACGITDEKNAAAACADRYFAAAALDDVTAVLPLYSPEFFTTTPRDTWVETLRQFRDRCRKPLSHDLVSWSVARRTGRDDHARAKLVYDVHYERCRTTETLELFRPSGAQFAIVSHSLEMNESAPAGSEKTTTV